MPDARFTQHFTPTSPWAVADGYIPTDLGFAAWTGDPGVCIAGAASGVAGTLLCRRLSVPGAMTYNNVFVQVDVAGSVLTAAQCFVGIWDGGGNLIALSSDASGPLGTAAFATIPMTSGPGGPPFASDTQYIYVGYWWNGTAGPGLCRGREQNTGTINGVPTLPATLCRSVTANTGLTTIGTAPAQLGALSRAVGAGTLFWCAVN